MISGMMRRVRVGGGLLLASVAATVWAYGVTVLEPLNEPGSPWHDESVGNNAYWAREIRWCAILAAVAALIVVVDGNRRRSAYLGAGAVAWLGVDLLVDRANLHAGALWPTALIAVVGVTVVAVTLAVIRPSGDGGRRALTTAMVLCAATAPATAIIQSPTDGEPALVPSRLTVAALLCAASLLCAFAAAPALSWVRVGAGTALGAGVWAVLAAGHGSLTVSWLAGSCLIAGTWLAGRDWRGLTTAAVGVLGTVIAYPLLVMLVAFVSWQAGKPFTALAGNPPVNGADTDLILTLVGILTGAAFTAFPPLAHRLEARPPALDPQAGI
jgi:hypothetical protein